MATQAERMASAVKRSGSINMVCHNYRRVPAAALPQKLIAPGTIGVIR